MDNNCAVELRHITKRFGKVVANDSIDLTINRGEILSLLGENGSGKTTLMKSIMGIVHASKGSICFMDRDITTMAEALVP